MSTSGGRPSAGTQNRPATPPTGGSSASAPRARPTSGAPTATTPRVSPPTSRGDEPRRVKLTLSRIDPFSVMKISFLLSVALGIAGVVVVAALWMMLQGMGVFSTLNDTLNELATSTNADQQINVLELLSFMRVISLAIVLGVANTILLTAMATLTAVIYNICAALVGGAQTTMTDV